MGRLLAFVGGVAWLIAMILVAFTVQYVERPRIVSKLATVPTLLKELNSPAPSASQEGVSWVVTKVTSAHHVLVVDVNATHLDESRAIATEIVDKVAGRKYDEVLVYLWSTPARGTFANRRVQWTRTGGYAELNLGD